MDEAWPDEPTNEAGSPSPRRAGSVSTPLAARIGQAISQAGGWLPFDRFMAMALYEPGLGYYARDSRKFGHMPASGSDFVTAPELSPFFGRALARQVAQALKASGTDEVFEFGAGSGALAAQLLDALDGDTDAPPCRYTVVELSASLRERQAQRLARFGDRVRWLDAWPQTMEGVVVGNEVLDAMPVQLLRFDGISWRQVGVSHVAPEAPAGAFGFADRATALRPPVEADFEAGTVTELHAQAEAFVASLAERLVCGAAFFIDYGFPQAEYYHPQRSGGTLMCHRAHRADTDPLADVGEKDITAHVDFTGIALAGQEAGLDVIGYTSQARFLVNCGLLDLLRDATLAERAMAHRLLAEHEMGELFKVLAFSRGCRFDPVGFAQGDRLARL